MYEGSYSALSMYIFGNDAVLDDNVLSKEAMVLVRSSFSTVYRVSCT